MSVDWGRAGGGRRRARRRAAEDERPKAAGERQRRRLQEALSELKDSDFWDSSRRTIWKSLRSPPAAQQDALAALGAPWPEALRGEAALEGPGGLRCVCYGLGSFCSCGKARLQLAFLLLLLEELKIAPERCFVFDPIFSTLEIEVLSGLGLTVLQWNEVKLGLLAKAFCENYSYIAKVLEATQEEALPTHLQHPDVFNDTSVHRFPLQKLRGLPQDCWACQPEPLYPEEAQLEIVRNKPQ